MSTTMVRSMGAVHLEDIGIVGERKLMGLKKVKDIVDKYDGDKKALINILSEVQEEYGWIPENVLEYVAQRLDIPLSKLEDTVKNKDLVDAKSCAIDYLAYYPECRGCGTKLTNEPFTDMDTVTVTSYYCPKCGKENWFYIDLERMFRNKNMWCPECQKFTREYDEDHKCPKCSTEVYRTKSRTNKAKAVEYYPRCPECRRILSHKPFKDINTVTVQELYCGCCDKAYWLYIDLEKIYEETEA